MRKVKIAVLCSDHERKDAPAKYKIAAEWVGGGFSELKTFGFADDDCLQRVFRTAVDRAARFRPAPGEQLGSLRVYLLGSGEHDYELVRMPELEEKLHAEFKPAAGAVPS